MHKYRFHDKWVLPLLVLLLCSAHSYAQCPDTKSTSFAMVPEGLPSLERVQPTDFLINLSDTSFFQNMTLNKDHFLCIDVGIQEVLLSGTTTDGSNFTCEEFVWVYDSVLLCTNEIITPKAVAGKIITETNLVVPNIAIGLSSGSVNYFKGTDERGTFFFNDFEPAKYELIPGNPFDNNVRNGVSTLDVLFLQKHILGIKLLGSPYKLIAADLNNSGDITAYDMLLLRQMILSVIEEFPNTPSWRFVDANHVFKDPNNPFLEDLPQSISLDMEALAPQLDTRFIAIKMGDLNDNVDVTPSARRRSNMVSKGSPLLRVTNQIFQSGEIIEVPFQLNQAVTIEGGQFAFTYDVNKLTLMDIELNGTSDHSNFKDAEGKVGVSWINETGVLFPEESAPIILKFRTKQAGDLSLSIHQHTSLSAEIYTESESIIPFHLAWETIPGVTTFQAFNNYPNPFSSTTTIPFSLPENGTVRLIVSNAKGQVVMNNIQDFPSGKQSFELMATLPMTGIYFYQLESKFGVATGRLNYIER